MRIRDVYDAEMHDACTKEKLGKAGAPDKAQELFNTNTEKVAYQVLVLLMLMDFRASIGE